MKFKVADAKAAVQAFQKGGDLPKSGVHRLAVIEGDSSPYSVKVTLNEQDFDVILSKESPTELSATCSCESDTICPHVAAAFHALALAAKTESTVPAKPPRAATEPTAPSNVQEDEEEGAENIDGATQPTPRPVGGSDEEQRIASILQRYFPPEDLEWRISRAGWKTNSGEPWAVVLTYITARALHERLDEAFGIAGWRTEFRELSLPGGNAGVICRLWVRIDSEWTWRENGAPQTDFEAFKGGLSGAEKRAGAELGIGRYLYSLPESFAPTSLRKTARTPNRYYSKTEKKAFYWGPPQLPAWAVPKEKT